MSDFTVIAHFSNLHEAAPAMALLEASEIGCELRDTAGSSMMKPFDMVGSTVKLMVLEDDSVHALEILIDEGIIKPGDLGPDPAMAWLGRILNKPWIIKMLNNGKLLSMYLIAILLLLFLLILVIGYGGGKF